MPRILQGRTIAAGFARASALVGRNPFMFAYGIEPQTGRITDPRHDLYGRSVRGHVLVFPHAKGPTTGSTWLLETVRLGNGPAAVLCRESEPAIAAGLILSQLLYGRAIPAMDRLTPDPLAVIRTSDLVEVDAARSRVTVWREPRQ